MGKIWANNSLPGDLGGVTESLKIQKEIHAQNQKNYKLPTGLASFVILIFCDCSQSPKNEWTLKKGGLKH